MIRKTRWAALALVLTACGGGGGGPSPQPQPQPSSSWQFFYSNNVRGGCDNFDFGEPHYCVKQMGAQLGQTITMSFTVSGSGQLYPTGAGDIPPAKVTLFLWRRNDNLSCAGGYQQYRYWSIQRLELVPGTQTIRASLNPDQWTDCFGQSGAANPGAFQAALNDLQGVGYTFGGGYFAGHGVAANGQVHFTLNSFTVGNFAARRHRKLR